jgi:exosortase/archaeosortase
MVALQNYIQTKEHYMKLSKSIKIALSCLAMTTMSSAAFATPTYTGLTTIQSVVVFQSGVVLFTVATTTPSSPWSTCNGNHQFAFNTGSLSGQTLYKNVLTAQQGAKGVYIVGTGACTLKNAVEDLEYMQINP